MDNKEATVTAWVPATTANLGSGFDTLGIGLKLYNRVEVGLTKGSGVNLSPGTPGSADAGAEAMLRETLDLFCAQTGLGEIGVDVRIESQIPIARGLGSSVTLRLGLIGALDRLAGTGLSRSEMLTLVTRLEHHPDNAAPALFGGFAVAGLVDERVQCQTFPISDDAKFVTLIPGFEVSTEAARTRVPEQYSKGDAIHGVNRAALVTACLARGDLQGLKGLFDDRLHQPYRAPLVEGLYEVIRAGEHAGAIGGWLSGSGSTIVCLTLENEQAVANAMHSCLPSSEVKILRADNEGLAVRPAVNS